ncbi:MAG: fluoride efflux transporter CrcB [Muribaculaceae bacterium]|nr:fluoride efflux transporter CrcB [Muribaculaceae bacterium]
MLKLAVVVFVGSGIGGVCRFLLTDLVNRLTKGCEGTALLSCFPWGTFIVNMAGCFLIGLIYGLVDRNVIMSQEARLLLTTGFCGGLTTFSTFSHENLLLFNDSSHLTLVVYAAVSLILGFSLAYVGHVVAR